MTTENSEVFGLQLQKSTLERAIEIARLEEISLNEFIILALAEKITRMGEERQKRPST